MKPPTAAELRAMLDMTDEKWQQIVDAVAEVAARHPGVTITDEHIAVAAWCILMAHIDASCRPEYSLNRIGDFLYGKLRYLPREFPDNGIIGELPTAPNPPQGIGRSPVQAAIDDVKSSRETLEYLRKLFGGKE